MPEPKRLPPRFPADLEQGWELKMRILLPLVIALSVSGWARADEPSFQGQLVMNGQTGIGQGIICDTSDQAGRFLALRNGGSTVTGAIDAVNTEARDPRACGAALVAFRMEQELQQASLPHMDGKPVSIAKIVVVAISMDGQNWSAILPKVQYTVLPAKGQDV